MARIIVAKTEHICADCGQHIRKGDRFTIRHRGSYTPGATCLRCDSTKHGKTNFAEGKHKHSLWKQLLLGILNECGGQASLQDIYGSIERKHQKGGQLINPELFKRDPDHEYRPKYHQSVRANLKDYRKQGLVEWAGKATYRLTNLGLKLLKELRDNGTK